MNDVNKNIVTSTEMYTDLTCHKVVICYFKDVVFLGFIIGFSFYIG